MKKLISSRRGAAIELAIGVMFVMIALSIILVTNASLQNKEMKSEVADLEHKIELMEITDKILADPDVTQYLDYKISNNNGTYTVTDNAENVVLTFTVDENGKIISWN